MKRLTLALVACLLSFPAAAQTTISAEIAASGLAATEARLASLAAPSDADRFALGAVRFLTGIEQALQLRYRFAMSPSFEMIPVLRLPIPENPAPEPFRPEVIREIFAGLAERMEAAGAALEPIPEGSDFGLEIRLADLWFDIDGDGVAIEGEDLFSVVGPLLLSRTDFDPSILPTLVIRFDVADSRWLMAYADLLGAVGNVVLAYDPTGPLTRVVETDAALAELNRDLMMLNAMDMNFGRFVDAFAVVDQALRQEPDAARAAAAHQGLMAMIAHNRDFWRLVRLETDNAQEWVPNGNQVSGLGVTMPEGAGETWLAVLSDAEMLLTGKLLIPYWRLGDGAGLNLGKMFLEPRPVDLVGWVQGYAALPYAERGPRISAENWARFDRLMSGQGMLFAAWLN